jgi:hypothetical protein
MGENNDDDRKRDFNRRNILLACDSIRRIRSFNLD